MKTKTQRGSKDRAKPSKIKRSKPDTVNQPVRTAHTFVHHYKSTQYCNTETVFFQYFNIPLPPDQHHISDVAKWKMCI